jgi:hypothetical protein
MIAPPDLRRKPLIHMAGSRGAISAAVAAGEEAAISAEIPPAASRTRQHFSQ